MFRCVNILGTRRLLLGVTMEGFDTELAGNHEGAMKMKRIH